MKKGETKTHYEPGYWVKKLEKDGYFRRERITKAEFKKIKHCIPYEGGYPTWKLLAGTAE